MSFNEFYFKGSSTATTDLAEKIRETGIFTDVTADTSTGLITCFYNDVDFLSIYMNTTYNTIKQLSIKTAMNATLNVGASGSEIDGHYILTTSRGFALHSTKNGDGYQHFVSKCSTGEPIILTNTPISTSEINFMGNCHCYTLNSLTIPTGKNIKAGRTTGNITSMYSVVAWTGCAVSNGIYIIDSAEITLPGKIMLNGTKYYTNGYVALAD